MKTNFCFLSTSKLALVIICLGLSLLLLYSAILAPPPDIGTLTLVLIVGFIQTQIETRKRTEHAMMMIPWFSDTKQAPISCSLADNPGFLLYKSRYPSCDTLAISRIDFRHYQCLSLQKKKKNIRQIGLLSKYSASHFIASSCKLGNLVAQLCWTTDLRCRMILPAQTLASQQVPCLGKTKYGEGTTNFFMQSPDS